ncbi:MAG: outer membrane protein assembly factor BamA [Alphaproteobacteria bacterium]
MRLRSIPTFRLGLPRWFAHHAALAFICCLLTITAFTTNLSAQSLYDGGQISNIQVQGNQRVETGSIMALIGVEAGDKFDPTDLNKATKALYASGFFKDVSLNRSGSQLIISVVENPIINKIAYEGNYSVKEEILNQELRLSPRSVVTTAKVKADVQRALGVYRASGRYDVTIDPKLIRLSQNRVNLVYEIEEGPKSKIRSINFIGNRSFSDSRLRREVISRQAAWYRFLTSVDTYDPDRIGADEELLRRFYQKSGFADFEIKSTLGELRETDRSFALTFAMSEGPKYRIGTIKIENKLPGVSNSSLVKVMQIDAGDVYNGEKIDASAEAIRDEVGNQGFAFVEVKPKLDKDPKTRTANITFEIGEGPKVYVERVNITGNVRTLDRVIRREFRLVEGDAFSIAKVRRTRQRVQGLGFFSKVDIQDRRGSTPDSIILDMDVEEQSTGSLQFGATYSSNGGIAGTIGLSERNFLGRGTQVNADLNLSKTDQAINFSVTEPYFLGRNLTAGTDLFYTKTSGDTLIADSFDQLSLGSAVRVGYAINEELSQSWGLTAKFTKITPVGPAGGSTFINDEAGSTLRVILSHGLSWQRLDNPSAPRKGVRLSMRNEYAGLGGDVDYLKTTGVASAYYPLGDNFTIATNLEAGIIHSLNSTTRVSDRFFIGETKIRGFSATGIGPRLANGTAIGGTKYYVGTGELRFKVPNPLEFDVEGRVFIDAGSLWDPDNNYGGTPSDSSGIRSSYGLGLSWVSPIGPLQLDYGFPISKEAFDVEQRFRFSIGTRF